MSAQLRLLRLQNGMTLDQLARTAGLTRSYVSKVERGVAMPSIASALHLAKALDVSVEQLFNDQSPKSLAIERAPANESLAPRPVAGAIERGQLSAFVMRPSQNPLRNPSSRHSGEELIYVLSGRVELKLASRTEVLEEGDSAHFDSAIPHKISSLSEPEARILIVVAPPSSASARKPVRRSAVKPKLE